MQLLRHPMAAIIMFAGLVTLFIAAYNGLAQEDSYNVTDTSARELGGVNATMMEHLNNLHIVAGLNQTASAILSLQAPTGGGLNTVNRLAEAGFGLLVFVVGFVTFVPQILGIAGAFYPVPTALISSVFLVFIIYVIMIYYSAGIRGQV